MQINYANSSNQHTEIAFRTAQHPDPESTRLVRIPCAAGAQVKLFAGDQSAVALIVMQLAKAGAVDVDEMDRTRDVVRGVYAIDKNIDMKKVARQIERNAILLTKTAFERRKNTAVAAHIRQNDVAAQAGPHMPRPHNTVMELSEVVGIGQDAGGKETIEVVTEGHEPLVRGGNVKARAGRGRRRAA